MTFTSSLSRTQHKTQLSKTVKNVEIWSQNRLLHLSFSSTVSPYFLSTWKKNSLVFLDSSNLNKLLQHLSRALSLAFNSGIILKMRNIYVFLKNLLSVFYNVVMYHISFLNINKTTTYQNVNAPQRSIYIFPYTK